MVPTAISKIDLSDQVDRASDGTFVQFFKFPSASVRRTHICFETGQATPNQASTPALATSFDLTKDGDASKPALDTSSTLASVVVTPAIPTTSADAGEQNEQGEQVSAADYDPSLDRREDDARRARHAREVELADGTGEVQVDKAEVALQQEVVEVEVEEEEVEEEEEEEDLDDMFAIVSDKPKKTRKVKALVKKGAAKVGTSPHFEIFA